MDPRTKELIAIGASVSANCIPCIKYHVDKGQKLGLDSAAIQDAIAVGQMVRKGAAGEMDKVLQMLAGTDKTDTPGCGG